MKFKPVVIFEIVLAILFVTCELLKGAHIPYMALAAVLSACILSGLYFYGGFYVLGAAGLKIINPIIYGLAFSLAIVALVYKLQKWPFSKLFIMIGLVFFALIALIRIISYLANSKQVLQYNRGIAIRYFILWTCMIWALLV